MLFGSTKSTVPILIGLSTKTIASIRITQKCIVGKWPNNKRIKAVLSTRLRISTSLSQSLSASHRLRLRFHRMCMASKTALHSMEILTVGSTTQGTKASATFRRAPMTISLCSIVPSPFGLGCSPPFSRQALKSTATSISSHPASASITTTPCGPLY